MEPGMWIERRNRFFLISLTILILLTAAGCGGTGTQGKEADIQMASMAGMPEEVQAAPMTVQQAYQFAAANPDIMSQIPCYCGCGSMGHTSNYACYVAGKNTDGSLAFDTHALGCSICVDITQDTMRLLKEGKTVQEIRAYIDQTYAQYGPSNMP
jgi:hypothetical protein